jgi:GNAT superfamily N-acetyltransferase
MPEHNHIFIRDFNTSDLPVIKNLIDKTIDISYPAFYCDEAIAFFKHHHCEENISKDAEHGHTVVLEEDAQIIGTGTILDNEIKRVFIDPAFQKHGFGKLIMSNLEARASSQGIKLVKLDASLPAKRFYDSLGYQTLEKTFTEVTNGERLDYYKMEKLLK